MATEKLNPITVEITVNKPISQTWEFWTNPEEIVQWCFASPEWHCPYAENDIKTGGKFKSTMAAKDGSVSFDFEGIYSNVIEEKLIEYGLADGRQVKITFKALDDKTKIIETFDPESENPIEMQKGGWQAILDNFKAHAES